MTASAEIDAPPEVVWRCIEEPEQILRWVEGAVTHRYLDDRAFPTADTYTITVSVRDGAPAGPADDTRSAVVAVANANPQLTNVQITNVTEGGVSTLTGTIADAGSLDAFTLEVNWGDGSALQTFTYPAGTTAFSETHRYEDDNPTGTASDNYTVRVRLLDNTPDLLAADTSLLATDTVLRVEGTTGLSLGTLIGANASGIPGASEISGIVCR